MKEDEFENLTKKYEAGASTLREEQFLLDNAEEINPNIEAWSIFVKTNKREIPGNFNNTLWESFQRRTNKKRRIKIRIISAAASILLIIAVSIVIPLGNKPTYEEKEALLTQARNMLAESDQLIATENIIYEDEMIIIYTSIE